MAGFVENGAVFYSLDKEVGIVGEIDLCGQVPRRSRPTVFPGLIGGYGCADCAFQIGVVAYDGISGTGFVGIGIDIDFGDEETDAIDDVFDGGNIALQGGGDVVGEEGGGIAIGTSF